MTSVVRMPAVWAAIVLALGLLALRLSGDVDDIRVIEAWETAEASDLGTALKEIKIRLYPSTYDALHHARFSGAKLKETTREELLEMKIKERDADTLVQLVKGATEEPEPSISGLWLLAPPLLSILTYKVVASMTAKPRRRKNANDFLPDNLRNKRKRNK